MAMLPPWYTTNYTGRDACTRHNRKIKRRADDERYVQAFLHAYSSPSMPTSPEAHQQAMLATRRDPVKVALLRAQAGRDTPPSTRPARRSASKVAALRAACGLAPAPKPDDRPSNRPPPAPCSDVIPGGCFPRKNWRRT